MKLFLVTFVVLILTGCAPKEKKKSSENKSSPKNHNFNKSDKKNNSVNKLDYSWVPEYKVICAKHSNCISSMPVIFSKPEQSSKEKDLFTCLGILIDKNTILTSAACLPKDLAIENKSCKGRIVFKFPSVSPYLPERIVKCDKVEKFSFASQGSNKLNSNEISTKPSYAVLKISEPVYRSPGVLNNLSSLKSGAQYEVGSFEIKTSNYNTDKKEIVLSSKICPSIENETTVTKSHNYLAALDCNLKNSSGAPIFYHNYDVSPYSSENSIDMNTFAGLVHPYSINGKGTYDQINDIWSSRSSYRYKVYLGFSYNCIDKVDCSLIDTSDFLEGEIINKDNNWKEKVTRNFNQWVQESPLSNLIEWELVEDISDYAENNYGPFFLATHPTKKKVNSREMIYYEKYQMSTLVPKCVKTFDIRRWIENLLNLNSLTYSQRSSLERQNREGRDNFYIPDTLHIPIYSWVRKEYKTIGSSNFSGNRNFDIELYKFDKDEGKIKLWMKSFELDKNDWISYAVTLYKCNN